ncbi:MAG: response regulator [Ekhidna sp.]|nr:response regulator [Ekhidna sp.]
MEAIASTHKHDMEPTARPTKKQYNILYVDDEPHNLRVFKSSFRRYYNVLTAESAYDAIEILKENKIHLVVTDQKMPGMTGTQFLEQIKPDYPEAISMIITGFSDIDDITNAINKCGIYSYITKPWDAREVKLTIEKALEVYSLRNEKESLIQELFDASINLEDRVEERTSELKQANSKIYDSIDYALTIQRAILPDASTLNESFSDSFIYYKAQDIVSGDFYFYKPIDGYTILGAFDCTGHGVPGALLSILGFTTLENIVENTTNPDGNVMLKKLNSKVNSHLSAKKARLEDDGMDGSLVILDEINQQIHLFAANSEIIYFEEGEMKSFKGNKVCIGSQSEMDDFTALTLDAHKVSEIYLSSDGYKDQLNESNNKKFSGRRFRELIESFRTQPMSQQMEILDNEMKEWKGSEGHSNDDIMVLGIRI